MRLNIQNFNIYNHYFKSWYIYINSLISSKSKFLNCMSYYFLSSISILEVILLTLPHIYVVRTDVNKSCI